MNASDILKYGNLTVLGSVDKLPDADWETAGVCGWWSVKQIIAHLASYEAVLSEVLTPFVQADASALSTPTLDEYRTSREFNDKQVASRDSKPPQAILAEYTGNVARNQALVASLTSEKLIEAGTIPWYGTEYALDDFIVYAFYGHKREHSAQIDVFRDHLKR